MKLVKPFTLLILVHIFLQNTFAQKLPLTISSPDNKIVVNVITNEQQPYYTVTYLGKTVLEPSKLGIIRDDGDFTKGLSLYASSSPEKVNDRYQMVYAKRRDCFYQANKRTFHFRNASQQPVDVIFQVSNDGVAFRYYFPGKASGIKTITEEITSWHFPASAKAWLQPMSVAKTGWEVTNPSYEENYQQGIAVGTAAPTDAGWVYPCIV